MKKPLQLASEELLKTCLLGVREIWRCFNLRREGNTFRSSKNKKQAATNAAQFGCEFRTQAHWSEAVTLTAARSFIWKKDVSGLGRIITRLPELPWAT